MTRLEGKFWIPNRFIRLHAKKFTPYEQMTYVTLCCHANKNGITFIGCRAIAKLLNINNDTVNASEIKLEKYGLIERPRKNNKVSHIKILIVPYQPLIMSRQVGHKEVNIKEDIKEEKKNKMESIGAILKRKY